jgi:hypothetical protein
MTDFAELWWGLFALFAIGIAGAIYFSPNASPQAKRRRELNDPSLHDARSPPSGTLVVETPWDEYEIGNLNQYPNSFLKRILSTADTLAELVRLYDLEITADDSGFELSFDLYWTNFSNHSTIRAEYTAEISIMEAETFELRYTFGYSVRCECKIEVPLDDEMDHEIILYEKWLDNARSISTVRSTARRFFEAVEKARQNPNINAPFGRFDELPNFPNVERSEEFVVQFVDRFTNQECEEVLTYLSLSHFDFGSNNQPKWLRAYSRKRLHFINLRADSVKSLRYMSGKDASHILGTQQPYLP